MRLNIELIAIRDTKHNYQTGLQLAQEFGEGYSSTYPSLVKVEINFLDNLRESSGIEDE